MNVPYLEHPGEEVLERFLLKMSTEVEVEAVETHVFACGYCVEQLEHLEIQIAATRLALQNWQSRPASKRSNRFRRWKSWFTVPRLSFVTAGALMTTAGLIFVSIPRDVDLMAFRGAEKTPIVAEWRPLHMHLNAADLLPGPVVVELADARGSLVWKGTSVIRRDAVDVTLPRITRSGAFFLRLYSQTSADAQSVLLREFALEARLTL